jgi:molybdopterin synthase sulfur carrier subunit
MPKVVFTSHLQRHVDCPDVTVDGTTVRDALEHVFAANQKLRSYILDDQSRLRTHMVIFVDGVTVKDRDQLSDSVHSHSEIYVMQALSGG